MRIPRIASAPVATAALAFLAACASIPGATVPARSDASFARVERGMPQGEVRELLGGPDESMRFPLSRSEAWDYWYYDTWGYLAVFSVTFGEDGRVASTISNRINSGGDHGSG
jgi:hypothetical protein